MKKKGSDYTDRRQITGSAHLFEAVDGVVEANPEEYKKGFAGYVQRALRLQLQLDGVEPPPPFDGEKPGRKPGAQSPRKAKRGAKPRT